jgi:predicted Holliday junction resolvase-like endonuclease
MNVVFLFLAVIIVILLCILAAQQKSFQDNIVELTKQHHRHVVNLSELWETERSELLDRIQAPTFGELKNAEIKMVKAQQPEEPKPSFILE